MFSLEKSELERLSIWKKQQYARVVELQKGTESEKMHFTSEDITYPYFGAIGGEFTYEFTPTGLGTIAKVIFCKGHATYEAEIDLTDYASW